MLGSTDLSHYSLLRWLPSKAANGMRSSVGAAAPPATNPPQPSVDLGQLSCEEVLALADDALSYERARQLGFMRGVLLPVRNALGNAARVGALLEEGPGPHNTGMAQVGRELAMRPLSSVLGDVGSASFVSKHGGGAQPTASSTCAGCQLPHPSAASKAGAAVEAGLRCC